MFRNLFILILVTTSVAACTQNLSSAPTPDVAVAATNAVGTAFAAMTQSAPTQTAIIPPTAEFTPTQTATQTAIVFPTAESTPTQAATATLQAETVSGVTTSGWEIKYYEGADIDSGDGTTFRSTTEKWNIRDVAPELWPTFPNEPNPLVPEFRVINGDEVPDGLENAMDESNFCQQNANETCRFPVAPEHYMSFTGDYKWNDFACEEAGTGIGCHIVFVNVGKVSCDLTAYFGQGFRLHARYWNGDKLDMAMWALTSFTANTMLNLPSELNPDSIANAGGNCSNPEACIGVDHTIVFLSGNEILMSLHTVVMK